MTVFLFILFTQNKISYNYFLLEIFTILILFSSKINKLT